MPLKIFAAFVLLISTCTGQGTALTFGGATTNVADCGSSAGVDDFTSMTASLWVYPTTLTDGRVLISKADVTGADIGWQLRLSGTGGDLEFRWARATTAQSFITNSTPLATLNKWYYVVVTSSGTGGVVHIYVGDLTTALIEATYGTSTAGSGALAVDNNRNLAVGNRNDGPYARAFQGRISVVANLVRNNALTLAQATIPQWQPRNQNYTTAGIGANRLFLDLGVRGTTAPFTLSGNQVSCAITGATSSDGVPIAPMFGAGVWSMFGRYFGFIVRHPHMQFPPEFIR